MERQFTSLPEVEEATWALMARGAADRRSPMHTPVLGSIASDGRPALRTVVLRAVDRAGRSLRMHTDARSPKVAELTGDPRAELLLYDPGAKMKIRLSGQVAVHVGDAVAREAWEASSLFARRCYLVELAPGSAAQGPASGLPAWVEGRAPDQDEVSRGFGNFAVLLFRTEAIDWLYLAHSGHRRARFVWRPDQGWLSSWATP